uniref:Uncharacterized protein n=1 Tax=Siphoviridae sp. ctFSL3 TaxID=2825404 RepID=A0A8S5PDJ1_9CAUD|nr:MAG TPA: hypothetical protein [Siphoviridae sp. ctFSL3]
MKKAPGARTSSALFFVRFISKTIILTEGHKFNAMI